MTALTGTETLADLVTANPARARVLEGFHLDYCCHGERRLVDACAPRGLDPHVVAAALVATDPVLTDNWSSLAPAQLADHIERTHHAFLHAELSRLSALLAKVNDVHGARHPELADVTSTYEELRADLEPHLVKEERVLFPMIRELSNSAELPQFHCGTLRNPISAMMTEHDRAGELLAQLRTQSGDYHAPDDACASFRMLYSGFAELEADTHLHIHKENNVLFPAALRLESESASRPDHAV